jgi:hypothetical protein
MRKLVSVALLTHSKDVAALELLDALVVQEKRAVAFGQGHRHRLYARCRCDSLETLAWISRRTDLPNGRAT